MQDGDDDIKEFQPMFIIIYLYCREGKKTIMTTGTSS